MRYGLNLPTGGACGDPRFLLELCLLAERAGWDGVFLEDYVDYQAQDTPTSDTWSTLAAVAVSTERILLGSDVTPLSRRRPWNVAQQVATVDHLSGGRAVLGVGIGDPQDPGFRAAGEPVEAAVRASISDEALEIIARLWKGQPVSFIGKRFRLDGLAQRLQPLQKPRVPIWVGGLWPRRSVVQRAARWDGAALGWKVGPEGKDVEMTPNDLRKLRTAIAELRGDISRYEFVMGGRARHDDPGAEREWLAGMAEAGATWWTEWVKPAPADEMRNCVVRGPLRVE
jgi:alkanesulfonate monooxygenase SsuD/methylene tetrahydromethanopterin reductase-like flavin-dependent oxidoreductase (luciferase family)